MKNFYIVITLTAFLLTALPSGAEEYGTPAPLDPVFMQGIGGGRIKPVNQTAQNNKPGSTNNKPGSTNNKPGSTNNKPGSTRGR